MDQLLGQVGRQKPYAVCLIIHSAKLRGAARKVPHQKVRLRISFKSPKFSVDTILLVSVIRQLEHEDEVGV